MSGILISSVKFPSKLACPNCAQAFDQNSIRTSADRIELDCQRCHHVAAVIEIEPTDDGED